ncbi:2-hydroxyacyl-CoA dehydratase family protein [Eubacteriaceae bacterium ES2]|nr:2-hydroxyacyl-CoA dehydratase family protein [Eubacteriaceae bacterium ES2]
MIQKNDDKFSSYQKEYLDTLKKLMQESISSNELHYFYNVIYSYLKPEQMIKYKPEIIVMGSGIPEELIYAAGSKPFYILGGSHGAVSWSDDAVPRDTDPVSRSMLGFLLNETFNLAEKALIICPITCDANRKIAWLLKNSGKKVVTVDIPPDKSDPLASIKWTQEMKKLSEKISEHTKEKITEQKLKSAARLLNQTRKLMSEFITLCEEMSPTFKGSTRMAVLNAYYYCRDLRNYSMHLKNLNLELIEKIRTQMTQTNNKPSVLLMGSPVFLPNYKIPFLIEDIGMHIEATLDVTTQKIYSGSKKEHQDIDIFTAVIFSQLRYDCSTAYSKNEMLYQSALWQIRKNKIDGVIFHVLKGQIEYDFELERLEKLFAEAGTPVFRLETDYQYQDVEQLRIRMEAFMEMLTQNQYRENRAAV